ncbi:MAG: hypothetical protein ACI307_04795 [Sodaliphilus sp.]
MGNGCAQRVSEGGGVIKGGISCKVRYEACALQPMPLCVDSG